MMVWPRLHSLTGKLSPDDPLDPVTFFFEVENVCGLDLTLADLSDTVYGDLEGLGTCLVPQPIASGGTYSCEFTAPLLVAPGSLHVNVVEAGGTDSNGTELSGVSKAKISVPLTGGPFLDCPHCPEKISLRGTKMSRIAVAGELYYPDEPLDPTAVEVRVNLIDGAGTLFGMVLPPGELTKRGRHYTYKNRNAKKLGGALKVELFQWYSGQWRFKLRAFDILREPVGEEITVEVYIGGRIFDLTRVWQRRGKVLIDP
jgi:hypothetical protein